jgi:hypothetical protein
MKKIIISLLILICTSVFSSAQNPPTNPKLKELDAKIKQKDAKLKQSIDMKEQFKLGTELNALKQQRKDEADKLAADAWLKE